MVQHHWTDASCRRRWTLNGDFAGLTPTGVARYARETVAQIDQLIGEGHPLTRGLEIDLVSPVPYPLTHIPNIVVPEYTKPRLPQAWVQLQAPRHAPGGLVSFCNLAPVAKSRHIACIHDIHTLLMPESFSYSFRAMHRLVLPALGRRAKRITPVSEFSADQLAAHGSAERAKISLTYNGAEHAQRWTPEPLEGIGFKVKRPFVACFGRPHVYKNIRLIWDLAPELDALGVDIVFMGDFDPGRLLGAPFAIPANVHLLGRVSDGILATLFANALCLAFPSRIEGFGLPAVEAMVHGCPVVAARAPCLPEICGDAALYAAPDRPDEWRDAIAALAGSRELAARYSALGRQRAARYRWRSVAEGYLRLMSELDSEAAASGTPSDARTG